MTFRIAKIPSANFRSRKIIFVVNPLARARDMTNHAKNDFEGSECHISSQEQFTKGIIKTGTRPFFDCYISYSNVLKNIGVRKSLF